MPSVRAVAITATEASNEAFLNSIEKLPSVVAAINADIQKERFDLPQKLIEDSGRG